MQLSEWIAVRFGDILTYSKAQHVDVDLSRSLSQLLLDLINVMH